MTASTAGKILVALAFASMVGGLSAGTALGQDSNWRRAHDNRGWQDRNRRDNDRWRDNGGWRDNRGWHPYRPVYAPPPVIYAPPPSQGISIFFPLFR